MRNIVKGIEGKPAGTASDKIIQIPTMIGKQIGKYQIKHKDDIALKFTNYEQWSDKQQEQDWNRLEESPELMD